jgi:hypothetical protein
MFIRFDTTDGEMVNSLITTLNSKQKNVQIS